LYFRFLSATPRVSSFVTICSHSPIVTASNPSSIPFLFYIFQLRFLRMYSPIQMWVMWLRTTKVMQIIEMGLQWLSVWFLLSHLTANVCCLHYLNTTVVGEQTAVHWLSFYSVTPRKLYLKSASVALF
jgi:hypothetical protein